MSKYRINEVMKKIKQGETYSINTKKNAGHKGDITKKKHSGKVIFVIRTHAIYTRGKKNIKLNANPQKNDSRDSYLLPDADIIVATSKNIGKNHPNEKYLDPVDKSIKRHLTKKRMG